MVKVRFAPSPTGHLHIGGLRGALFNYYFAKKHNGKFVIRIEDTDLARNKLEYTDAIIKAFDWCGIHSDEPLVYQSQRMDVYQKYINILLTNGCAYKSEEYDEQGNLGTVIKCRVNREKDNISFHDIIRGEISFPLKEIDDFIIVRSNGMPLYNFVVVVDDIDMQITHIIRGEEHLSNTPKQIILYQSFQATIPAFAHLPLILGHDRKKLSKRDAATAVIDYKKEGFLPDALCMYLLRLGWAHGDQEIFTEKEILTYFSLEDIHHSGAIFDLQKLKSMNHLFLKKLTPEQIGKLLISEYGQLPCDHNTQMAIISLYLPRISTLIELYKIITIIITAPIDYCFDLIENAHIEKKIAQSIINLFLQEITKIQESTYQKFLENPAWHIYQKHTIYTTIRFALLGLLESPSIITIMEILGKEEVIKRLTHFLEQ